MSEPPKRIIIEKSKTVRRKYLRRNNTFQYTASQIARIDREEERERRAEQLREKEKRRVANKKKKAQKEAEEREERRRQGAPDPHILRVPSSQPLLSNFLAAKPKPTPTPTPSPSPEQAQVPEDHGNDEARNEESDTDLNTEPDTPGTVEEDLFDSFELDDAEAENLIAVEATAGNLSAHEGDGDGSTTYNEYGSNKQDTKGKEEDEFSDCSAFYDEDFIREAELVAVTTENKDQKPQQKLQQTPQHLPVPEPASAPGKSALEESFRDDAADVLEEFAYGFDETIG